MFKSKHEEPCARQVGPRAFQRKTTLTSNSLSRVGDAFIEIKNSWKWMSDLSEFVSDFVPFGNTLSIPKRTFDTAKTVSKCIFTRTVFGPR